MHPENQKVVDEVKELVQKNQFSLAAERVVSLCVEKGNHAVEVLPSLVLLKQQNPQLMATIVSTVEHLSDSDHDKVVRALSFCHWYGGQGLKAPPSRVKSTLAVTR